MSDFLKKWTMPTMAPEDEGGSGAAGGAASDAATANGGDDASSAATADGGDGASSAANGGDGVVNQPGASPYKPDGLDPALVGSSDQETIDKMASQLKGYRDRDAQRHVGQSPEVYADFSKAEMPDEIKGHMAYLTDDPLMKEMSVWAKEQKIPVADFQAVVVKAHEMGAKLGILSDMVDETAERQALVPDAMKSASPQQQEQAAKERVDQAENWLALQAKNGVVPQELAEYAGLMLLDRAKGVQVIEWMQKLAGGGNGAPAFLSGSKATGDTPEALRAEMQNPEMQPGHPKFDRAKYEVLQQRYREVHSGAN